MTGKPVLVVGATGSVGQKVVKALRERDREVRALVRPGSDASAIIGPGVTIARGDMMDPGSLDTAFDGVDAVISTAAGYTKRRKSDTADIDVVGNRNLVDAARNAGTRRFVLCSILNCHETPDVPHFWHKKLAEDFLESSGVPFVALRPGAFLDQSVDIFAKFASQGRFFAFGDKTMSTTYVYTEDLAQNLVAAVDVPGIDGERIDIGWDRPVSVGDIAGAVGQLTGRGMKVRAIPWWLLMPMLGLVGVFSESARDIKAMLRYMRTGRYVADTRRQGEVFGAVPTAEDAIARWLDSAGLALAGASEKNALAEAARA